MVAAEVRKLAERSQISAVEIDALTKTSVRNTDESVKLMEGIVPEIAKTAKLVQEIAAASIEQNSGADQVNNAIQQLNQVTQQNAATSEEMATSSEELAKHAEQLMELVAFFKIDNSDKSKKKNVPAARPKTYGEQTNAREQQEVAHNSRKGVKINMGRDNMDTEYEKF